MQMPMQNQVQVKSLEHPAQIFTIDKGPQPAGGPFLRRVMDQEQAGTSLRLNG